MTTVSSETIDMAVPAASAGYVAPGSGVATTVQHLRHLDHDPPIARYLMGGPGFKRGLQVQVLRDHGSWVAAEPESGICGVGDDGASAITDLRSALREYLDVLDEAPALAPNLLRLREWLDSHLSRPIA